MGRFNAEWKRAYWIGRALLVCGPEPHGKKYINMTQEEKISKLLYQAYFEATGTTYNKADFNDATSFKG
jgi:hypothetical protein